MRTGVVGESAPPGGVCREVAFACSHLVYSSREELVQPHEGVGCQPGLVGIVFGDWVESRPVRQEGVPGSFFEGEVGFQHELRWRYICPRGRGGVEDQRQARETFHAGDDEVCHCVYGQVFLDGWCGDRRAPVEGEVHGGEALAEMG